MYIKHGNWTEEEENKLKELLEKGLTYAEVGKLLNRSYYSIVMKKERLGIEISRVKEKAERRVTDDSVLVLCPDHPKAYPDGYVNEKIVVAEEMIGRQLKEDETVNHRNGNPTDNRPENLEVLTYSKLFRRDRTSDIAKTKETDAVKGVEHHNAKLTPEKVREIRRLYEKGMSQRKLAKQFDVSYYTVNSLLVGRTWKNV